MLIRFPATSVCEQTGWAKIYAAMNYTEDTSLANHLSYFFIYLFISSSSLLVVVPLIFLENCFPILFAV